MPHDSAVPVKVEAEELYSPNGQVSPPAAVPDKRLSRSNSRRQSTSGTASKDQSPTPEEPKDSKSRVSQKRTEQNRRAQKAFRERKMLYVKNLEAQLEAAMTQMSESERLRRENSEMRAMLEALRAENQRLLRVAQRHGSRPTSPEDDSPSSGSSVSNGEEEEEEEEDDNEVPQSPPVDIGKLRAELSADSGLLSAVLTHIDADGRFAISNDMFFEAPASYVASDPVLFQVPPADEGALFPPSTAPIVIPDVPLTPAAYAARNAAAAAGGDYFGFTPMVAAQTTTAAPAGIEQTAITTPIGPETMIALDPSLFPVVAAAPLDVAVAAAASPAAASPACAACHAGDCPAHGVASPAAAVSEPPVGHKRTLDEATLYAPAGTPPASLPRFFAKNEAAQKDPHQTELCELMSKTTCKEKNPELRQHAKFFKKTSI